MTTSSASRFRPGTRRPAGRWRRRCLRRSSPAGGGHESHIVVVGSMAVGKSTVGRGLAARLGRPFRDSDADLGATGGGTGRGLAEREGVEALHRWEAGHLLTALEGSQPAVVAAAASV